MDRPRLRDRRSPPICPLTARRTCSASPSRRRSRAGSSRAAAILFASRFLGGVLEDFADDAVGSDPVGLRLELQENPVTERRLRDRVEIVEGDVVAALEEGADFTGEHERLQPARAGAPADITPDAVELAPVGMGGGDQPGRVPQAVLGGPY